MFNAIASRALSIALLLVIHAPYISARKGGTTVHISLHLDAIESVTLAFYVIFAILTLLQALRAIGALKKRKADDDFSRRVPFILLIFLGILALLATHSLDAILESQSKDVTLTSLKLAVLEAMAGFVHALTHIFLCAALLLLLDYRNGDSKSRKFVIVFRVMSAVLLLLMFVSALARAVIGSTRSMSYSDGQQPPLAERAYVGLYHLFLACYLVLTAVICGLSVVLWMTRQLMDSQNAWLLFDANVLVRIVKIICPLLAIRAVYDLIFDVVTSTPQFYMAIDIEIFFLTDILIRGVIYFVTYSVALGLGFPRNVKLGRNK